MQKILASHSTSDVVRIAFYSHDTMGLGHIRRNMLLAQSVLQAYPNAEVLLLSGVRESGAYKLPKGADSVTLPTYFKTAQGEYIPRSLGTEVKRLVKIRRQTIHAALDAFEPNIFIVDNVPRGAMNELDSVLPVLTNRGTHIVLGLRDIIDEPPVVLQQWKKLQNLEIIRLYFSSLWIYGDPNLFDFVKEYNLDSDIANKLNYVDYLDQKRRVEHQGPNSNDIEIKQPYILCVVGGGQDGFQLAKAFMQAELPKNHQGLLITGALMPEEQCRELHLMNKQRPDIHLLDFVTEPLKLLQNADRVIAMGGYNTTTEILSFNKRALIVPRITPRKEQWIRASRLAEMGVIDCIHPTDLTPQALTHWLQKNNSTINARDVLNFNGLDNVVTQIRHILSA